MAIVHTISKDGAMSKGFALLLRKKFRDLREHCKWQVEVNDHDENTINKMYYNTMILASDTKSLVSYLKKNIIVN